MYDNGKCFCFNIEIGSLILGIFSCVVTGLISLACLIGLIYIYLKMLPKMDGAFDIEMYEYILCMAAVIAVLVVFCLKFVFSVFLCIGVTKKKASYVLAYFIYGFILILISFVISILYGIYNMDGAIDKFLLAYNWKFEFYLGELVFVVIYSTLLYMVYKTHDKFILLKEEDNKQPIEDYYY